MADDSEALAAQLAIERLEERGEASTLRALAVFYGEAAERACRFSRG
jgi:hypothetical protein